MAALIGLALFVAVWMIAIHAFGDRPHTVVRLERGAATLEKGRLPPGLLSELQDVARHQPDASGAVELRGQGDALEIRTPGLDGGAGQRVRNVVLLRRQQIRRA